MSDAPYMPLYIGDYIRDTRHLTTEQHGAYLLLLMAMWTAGGELKNDEGKLARTAGMSLAKWRKIGSDVMDFFTVSGSHITQKRLKTERVKYAELSEKRRHYGSLGGAAKALKTHKTHVAKATAKASHLPEQKASISEPISEDTSSLRSDVEARAPKPTPLSMLSAVLDPERAMAVVEHRKAKKAPLTASSAEKLARKLAEWPDPNEAADEMLAAGWQGFEVSWLEERRSRHGRGPPCIGNGHSHTQRLVNALDDLFDDGSQQASQTSTNAALSLTGPESKRH